MRTVELRTAYHWFCEECSRENFALPQKAEMTEEEREEAFRRFHDLDGFAELPEDWRQFEMVMVPETVTCAECGTEFNAIDERE